MTVSATTSGTKGGGPRLVISAAEARERIAAQNNAYLLLDLGKPEVYAQAHIAGAVPFAYSNLVSGAEAAPGMPPAPQDLANCLREHGVTNQCHVIAYDDEFGAKACRLAWTLHYLGHGAVSVIDGGLHAWINSGAGVTARPTPPSRAAAPLAIAVDDSVLASIDDVRRAIDDPSACIVDTRSAAEYRGEDVRARHGGHIPGAVNIDWQQTIDHNNDRRMLPRETLLEQFARHGVTPDRHVIVHCQTHHRSSHSYVMLRHIGFNLVSGYAGSWSEWGNRDDTPIERTT